MKSFFSFLILCIVISVNSDSILAQTKAQKLEQRNQAKAIDKAAKEAANIMCKCDAIKNMATTIQLYKDNPNLAVTDEVSQQVKGYIQESSLCIDKFDLVTKKLEQNQLQKYNNAVEERMLKKCPDVLKVIHAFSEMED